MVSVWGELFGFRNGAVCDGWVGGTWLDLRTWLLEILTFFIVMVPELAIVERNTVTQIRMHVNIIHCLYERHLIPQ